MSVDFAKAFDKQFGKLQHKKQERVRAAVALFLLDRTAPPLRNHALRGQWSGHRSISVGGNLRLHFKETGDNSILFVAVGTHSQLYS